MVETDLKTKLCPHGETSSSIRTWVQAEEKARAAGLDPPPRPSCCNCTTTHGLQNHTLTRPPTPPVSVYDVLAAHEAPALDVCEPEPALKLGDRPFYLSVLGDVYCAHKTRLKPITKAARPYVFKAGGRACGCALTLPRRAAKVGLGRCVERR